MPSFIITGGPGSGKSTLLNALSEHGFNTVPEVSRQLIREQAAAGGSCLPWLDLPAFAELCRQRMRADLENVQTGQLTFFDRGLPDIIAYLEVGGHTVSDYLMESDQLHLYQKQVFIAPPWEEIYVNDEERWQTFDEACALYAAIRKTYSGLGYQLIEMPRISVANRVLFILKVLKVL